MKNFVVLACLGAACGNTTVHSGSPADAGPVIDLKGANLAGADLAGADLAGVDLAGVDLSSPSSPDLSMGPVAG